MNRFLRWGFNFWLFPIAVMLGVALIWGAGLGQHVTADEPMYIRESGGFFVALHEGNYAETNRVIQPAVPTLWMGAWAFDRIYPEYARKGEVNISDFRLFTKLEKTPVSLMDLLTLARLNLVRLLAAALALTAIYLRRLFGLLPAFLASVLIVCDPFLFGHSTLLASDAPLAVFAFGSVVSFLGFIRSERPIDLLVSAGFGGLAVLSKITGLFLVGFVGVVLLVEGWRRRDKAGFSWFWRSIKVGAFWSAMMVGVCIALWPALWQVPVTALQSLLQFTMQSVEGAINSNSFFMGEMIPDGNMGGWKFMSYYPLTVLWRSTPVTLIGLGFVGVAGAHNWARKEPVSANSRTALWLAGFVMLFTLVMSISSKKFDRYLLPVYPVMDLLAGLGWIWTARQIRTRWRSGFRWGNVRLEIFAAALLVVIAPVGSWMLLQRSQPAPLNAYNPLMGTAEDAAEIFVVGWGEGLEQAAIFLNEKDDAKTLVVYSWYAAALNVQFVGRAKDLPISEPIDDAWLDEVMASDYVVVYAHQYQRQTSQRLLDRLAAQMPVYLYAQDGLEWVKVYDVRMLNVPP